MSKVEQLQERIAEYFSLGGLWNPEMMDHDKVSALLGDVRAFLAEVEALLIASPQEEREEVLTRVDKWGNSQADLPRRNEGDK